jgi:hypothetical protein
MKLTSLGTVASTKPSPPASHAHPACVRRLRVGSTIPASPVFPRSVQATLTEEEETPDSATSWSGRASSYDLLRNQCIGYPLEGLVASGRCFMPTG